ncbi:MAG: CPBP family intramembrane glutamic endopeptidase [Fimbriimonadales bacterium]
MSERVKIKPGAAPDRCETLWMLAYFSVYLATLFFTLESEAVHWITLVALPFGILVYLRRGSPGTIRLTLQSCGLARETSSHGLWWAIPVGIVLGALQLVVSQRRHEVWAILQTPSAIYLVPLSLLVMLFLAGFTEEFFFRGIIQSRLQRSLKSNLLAVIASSLLFAAYHIPYAYLNPNWPTHGDLPAAIGATLAQGGLIGLILGTVFVKSRGNLLACVIVHALIDTLAVLPQIKHMIG